jgi:hypothetical protein
MRWRATFVTFWRREVRLQLATVKNGGEAAAE